MDRSGPRLPSPWWVLLPGVLLALAGVRAVTAEMDAARADARDRARQAAGRVARAFETLIDESLAPLPLAESVVDPESLDSELRHLESLVVTYTGRWVPHGKLALGGSRDANDARADAELAEAVLRKATSDDALDDEATAAMLSATAETVETRWVVAALRVRAAEVELRRGRPGAALDQLDGLYDFHPAVHTPDGNRLWPRYPWLAALRLGLDALEEEARRDGPESAPPSWLSVAASYVVVDPWGLREDDRDRLLRRIDDAWGGVTPNYLARYRSMRRTISQLRENPPDTAVISQSGDARSMLILRRVTLDEAGQQSPGWVGGWLTEWTVEQRIVDEIRFVVADLGSEIALVDPSGSVALAEGGGDVTGELIEEVPISGAAAGWRAVARVPTPTGVPTTALLLAAVLAGATLTLGGGAFALSRAAREQARLAEDRRNFLDHVAHEVRTPAAALLALSEELESGHVESDKQATYHQHLLTESRRLADLVEETLDLTRLEGGRLVAKREPADMRDIVRDAVEAARPGDGRVVATLPDDEVPVHVDRAAIRRALRNLIDNALKHGAAPEPVQVTLEASQGGARVSVRDHGKGIPHQHAAHIFERFYRVPSKTHEVKGVGLGLALVKEVAEMHGGGVTAVNVTDGGALFLFELPLAGEETSG